jgi:cell division protein FtsB
MQTKIKEYQQKVLDFSERFRDIKAVGLLFFLVAVLLISWSGVKVIEANYRLQRQISEHEQQKEVQELANTNLKLQNEYFETAQYQELAARRNFGLAAPGETVWAVPKAVAMSHTVDLPDPEPIATQNTADRQPAYQRNVQAWMDFLFHRE